MKKKRKTRIGPSVKKIGLLSILLLAIVGFYWSTNEVNAAKVTIGGIGGSVDKGTRLGTLRKVGSPQVLTIYGRSASVPNMTINGVLAMCLDINLRPNYATKAYKYDGIITDKALKNLFYTAKKAKEDGRNAEYIASQVGIWGYQTGKSMNEIGEAIAYVLNNYGYSQGNNQKFGTQDGINYYKAIINANNANNITLYRYVSICGEYQSFMTTTMGTPCQGDECDTTCEGGNPRICTIENGKYYGINGKEVTEEQYKKECDGADTCPLPSQTGTGECTNTEFTDPDWGCIAGYDDYLDTTHNDKNNPYCSFYCRETLSSAFPFESVTFKAGQYFTVGSGIRNVWGPVEFQGTRECRSYYKSGNQWTEGVDTKTFVENYNNAVKNMPYDYTNWKNAERMNQAIAAIPEQQASATYHPECSHQEVDYHVDKTCYNPEWATPDWDGYWDCGYDVYKTVYDKYYPSTTYKKCNVNGSCWTETISGGCSRPNGDGNEGTYRNNYNNAVTKANTYVNYMRQCEAMNTPYTLNPVVNFDYHVDPTYSWSGELKSSYQDNSSASSVNGATANNKNGSVNNYASNCTGTNCNMQRYNCSGEYCTLVPNVKDNIYNVNVNAKTTTTVKTATYSLPDNLYQFVDKISGKSTHTIASNVKDNNAYINLKESTMPIDTYITPGRYKLYLSYSKLGNISNNKAHFDNLVDNIETDYMCPFVIKNEITGKECELDPTLPECNECKEGEAGCDNMSGIDVIYRTIKLGTQDVSFPSIDGDGRVPGSNWNSEDGSIVYNYITNNRGVKGEQVYTLTPLYKITLTPNIIKQIREYNKKINDYGDFNLVCEVDSSGNATGEKCMSNFIHNTVKAGGKTYNFSSYFDSRGTCQNITSGTFNSCADK